MASKPSEAVRIIATEDGSHSLYLPDIDETYHSIHGAINESQYVFVEQGLVYYYHQNNDKLISILEVGLGTGLNLLLSAIWAKGTGAVISYTALEPFPVP
ncbi:MAG: tRNA (5-methylaminomethyl-2-thiouridine)(34)-methyltransferase MnmD, partial [Cyclobacteriaceae bacterium]